MKTTIEIADPLLEQAKRLALRDKTTLRALVEQGLRQVVAESKNRKPFKFEPVVFHGDGLVPELEGADWSVIRDLSYEGRGG
jgi:Bacterial antitoxin of type II TA system, VapB